MSIKVNTQLINWVKEETVAGLLDRMRYTFPMVVVKIDGVVIAKSDYQSVKIPDDSMVEVIHLISGG
jgi:thiamine biosynthesis protein ThiS